MRGLYLGREEEVRYRRKRYRIRVIFDPDYNWEAQLTVWNASYKAWEILPHHSWDDKPKLITIRNAMTAKIMRSRAYLAIRKRMEEAAVYFIPTRNGFCI